MKKYMCILLVTMLCILRQISVYAETDDEIYEIYIQYTTINTEQNDISVVEEAINEISIPEIGARIHIVPVFIGNLASDTAYSISSGEKIDIVNVGLTNDMTTMVSEGLLLPLDELLEKYGNEILSVNANVSEAQKVNGVTYAISQYPYAANSGGFYYNKSMADSLGIDMHDGMTIEELGDIGEKLKKHGVYLTSVGLSSHLSMIFFCSMESFGPSGNYGVIMHPADNTEIINIYESDELREYYLTIRNWYEKGYLPENALIDETEVTQMFREGKIFGIPTNVTSGQLGNGNFKSFTADVIRTDEIITSTSGATEFMLGIASTCKNPEVTMKFINLIYSNPDVANLLNYGIEGLDYIRVDGTKNVITTDGTENIDNSGYGSGFAKFGNPMSQLIKYPLTDEYYSEIRKWENSAKKSLSFGYSFDAGDYALEAINISKILEEYLPILNVGFAEDVDSQIDELIEKLDEAGMNKIIEANNACLQEYLTNASSASN